MKKIVFTVLAVLLVCMFVFPTYAADRGKALVIHGTADKVGAGDQAVGDRLKSLGFTVEYILAKDSTENSGKGYALIYISESVTSADVGTKLTKTDIPVIIGEPGLFDEFLVGNYDSKYDSAPFKGKYSIKNDIVKSGLTSFSGFTSDAAVPGFLKEWGKGVTVICENADGAPAVTLSAKGAEMFDSSKAAGIRCTFFARGQDAATFTPESWKLFDALVNYIVPLPAATTTAKSATAVTTAKAASTATTAAQTADPGVIAWIMAAGAAAVTGTVTLRKRK